MAEFVIGRLKFVWRSAWTTATLYRKDDVVRYGGKSYVATANHTASADFYTDTANWDLMTDGIVWNNTWSSATKINLGDIYKYGNNTYICTTEHTSGSTFDFANFDIFTESTRWTGAYAQTYYYLNDIMKWGSHVYITTTEHDATGNTTPDLSKYTLYVPGLTWENTWADATLYQINDLVKYGNNIYICIEQHTTSGDIDYTKFDLFLPGLNFEDTWDVATNYQTGDIVTYGGYTYIAEQDSVGEIPYNNSANWKVLTTGYSYQNVWSNATAYKTGDVVRYGGNTYVAKVDTSAGTVPTLTASWDLLVEGLSFKGTWDVATQYLIGEVVEYSTNSYRAIQDSIGNQPDTSPAFWQVIAQGDSTATLTTQGDILTHNGTQLDRLARGQTGTYLTVDTNNDLAWTSPSTNVLHVAKTGLDTNTGSKSLPFLTIKYACSQASSSDVIFVEQGVYEEDLPIQVPAGVTLYGDSLRGCEVRPQVGDEAETMFLLNDSCNIRNFTFKGLNNGVVMALDPAGAIATASPYIQNCTSVNTGSIGIKIDGSVQASGYHSILANDFTQINSDGVGVHVSNGGRGEMVSVFTYYCDKGFFAETGGFIRALNCSSAYGEYGAVADGNNPNETALTVQTRGEQLRYSEASLTGNALAVGDTITGSLSGATADIIRVIDSTQRIKIVNVQNGPFTDGEACTTNGGANFTLLTPGQSGQTGYLFEIQGTALQSANAITVGSNIQFFSDSTYYTITGISDEDLVNGYAQVRVNPEKTGGIGDAQTVTVTSQFSNIRLTGHDFLDIGTGDFATTNYPNTPTQAAQQDREISETNGGRVYYVTTDQSGNFRVGEYFRVNQATGNATLNADAFDLSGLTELQLGSIGAQLGATINEFSTDQNLTGNSNTAVPTESAVKGYVDDQIANNAFQINKESLGTPGTFAKVEAKDNDTLEFTIKNVVTSILSDQALILPKGTTAERPASPVVGMLRYNTDLGFLEQYNAVGWAGIDAPPTVTNQTGIINEDTDSTITILGSNFKSGSTVAVEGSGVSNVPRALATTFISTGEIQAATNAGAVNYVGGASYAIKVSNPSGLSSVLDPAGTVDQDPAWVTSAGNVANIYYSGDTSGTIATISATDPEGQTLTYAETTSNLATYGLQLNSDGTITSPSGLSGQNASSDVTVPFTAEATADGFSVSRAFTITLKALTIQTYAYTGGSQTLDIQTLRNAGVTKIGAAMWGAAGGSETSITLGGGGGGFTEGEIDISNTSQNTLYMIVGEGGGSDGSTGVPGLISNVTGQTNHISGGGGLSGIFSEWDTGARTSTHSNSILVAGAGGGGNDGGTGSYSGGAGGGTSGQRGNSGNDQGGIGGTQSSGATTANNTGGSCTQNCTSTGLIGASGAGGAGDTRSGGWPNNAFNAGQWFGSGAGGNSSNGGGGGGGYYGGAGGGHTVASGNSGSGGGGSGYAGGGPNNPVTNAQTIGGSGTARGSETGNWLLGITGASGTPGSQLDAGIGYNAGIVPGLDRAGHHGGIIIYY